VLVKTFVDRYVASTQGLQLKTANIQKEGLASTSSGKGIIDRASIHLDLVAAEQHQ
jgi:hypothetical protein